MGKPWVNLGSVSCKDGALESLNIYESIGTASLSELIGGLCMSISLDKLPPCQHYPNLSDTLAQMLKWFSSNVATSSGFFETNDSVWNRVLKIQ